MTSEQAKILQTNPIWNAFLNGKSIEWGENNSSWVTVEKIVPDTLILYPERYRVRVHPLPPPPPSAETWNNPDNLDYTVIDCDKYTLLTKRQVTDFALRSHMKGRIEIWNKQNNPNAWSNTNYWGDPVKGDDPECTYRIKKEFAVAPIRVPLRCKDITPGAAIRRINSEFGWNIIISASGNFIRVTPNFDISYQELMDHYQITFDAGKTWKPCYIETK